MYGTNLYASLTSTAVFFMVNLNHLKTLFLKVTAFCNIKLRSPLEQPIQYTQEELDAILISRTVANRVQPEDCVINTNVGKIIDTPVTVNTLAQTCFKKLRIDSWAILRRNTKRNIMQQIEITIAIINVDSGGNPIFKHT